MNVFRLRGEQIRGKGTRGATTLSEIEADRGSRWCRRDVDRCCAVRHGDVGGSVPERLRRTLSAVGPRNVEERQPGELRLERRVDDRETCCSLPFERAEKDAAARDDRLAERDFGGHAEGARSGRIPSCDL